MDEPRWLPNSTERCTSNDMDQLLATPNPNQHPTLWIGFRLLLFPFKLVIWLALTPVLFLGFAVVGLVSWWRRRRFARHVRSLLAQLDRSCTGRELIDRLNNRVHEHGTIIIEYNGIDPEHRRAGSIKYYWWTADNVKALAPIPMPTDSERQELWRSQETLAAHPFDCWCYQRYFSLTSGTATRVACEGPMEMAELEATAISLGAQIVKSWSSLAQLEALER